jgi:ABC-type lipoprotein release transport system permease subunit
VRLPFFIARRYLFAKKSHNVINIISLISAAGIAIGTAVLIVILSVFNGFGELIKSLYGTGEADILILPSSGKSFRTDTITFERARELVKESIFCEIVTENVFVRYSNKEAVAEMKGVDTLFANNTLLRDYMIDGEFSLWFGEVPQAIAGRTLAQELGMRPHFIDPITIYFPSRYTPFSAVNPLSSVNQKNLSHSGTFAAERTMDKNLLFVPISVARELVEMEDSEVTAVEIYTQEPKEAAELIPLLKKILGKDYIIKDRFSQNETLYKMMRAEKFSIYIILLFVVIIISFNLYGSLSMLMIEKGDDVDTLRSMGANEQLISRIFLLEGWMISLLGMLVGVALGVLICVLQQNLGLVKMPGSFMIEAYPVVLKGWDIIIVIAGVSFVGYLSALLPVINSRKK